MTAVEIVTDIKNHVAKCQDAPSSWYAGITDDPEGRLFSDHNVDKANGAWIYRGADTEEAARAAEVRLLNGGFDGGTGGGNGGDTRYVYAFRKTHNTVR